MEHGAQTHTLPASRSRLELLARRCGYIQSNDAAAVFIRDLERHASGVRAVFNRVFVDDVQSPAPVPGQHETARREGINDEASRLIKQTSARLKKALPADSGEVKQSSFGGDAVERMLEAALPFAINPSRALRNLAAWADSFATYTTEQIQASGGAVSGDDWPRLIERLILVFSSQYLSHLLVSRPMLASALVQDREPFKPAELLHFLRGAVEGESDAASKTDALRRAWHRLVVDIGYRDLSVVSSHQSAAGSAARSIAGQQTTDQRLRTRDNLRTINLAQTALAESVLRIASEIALKSMGLDGIEPEQLPFAILGLGRLGHAGMDYGSDLDLLIVFDDDQRWPTNLLSSIDSGVVEGCSTAHEFYAKLTSQIVRVLSSITREGLLYRSDLRLRPEGKSGPVALGLASFLDYITNRASSWEHSAYLKAREVAGNLEFGERARELICDASFDAASRNQALREELRGIRARLMKEKGRGARPNIKWGRGGMTDVYFITRYLQLRDRMYYPPEKGTTALIEHLGERGSLDRNAARVLFEGYTFLRSLDHWMRLLLDRPSPVLPASTIALGDIRRALGMTSEQEVDLAFAHHTDAIHDVYQGVFG